MLTHANYYSLEADAEYMSCHQFVAWLECAAREQARQRGEYEPPDNTALLVGSYVDKGFLTPDEPAPWVEKNRAEILNKKGEPYAPFVQAEAMIARLRRDPEAVQLAQGEKQVILTGWIGEDHEGRPVAWKGAADCINDTLGIVLDLKTTRDFEPQWSETVKKKVAWYEVYNYWRQLAVYQALAEQALGKLLVPVILAVTKQQPPDIGAWIFEDPDRLTSEVEAVKAKMPEVMAMKAGAAPATRCGKCDYCRGTNALKIQTAESWR